MLQLRDVIQGVQKRVRLIGVSKLVSERKSVKTGKNCAMAFSKNKCFFFNFRDIWKKAISNSTQDLLDFPASIFGAFGPKSVIRQNYEGRVNSSPPTLPASSIKSNKVTKSVHLVAWNWLSMVSAHPPKPPNRVLGSFKQLSFLCVLKEPDAPLLEDITGIP